MESKANTLVEKKKGGSKGTRTETDGIIKLVRAGARVRV